MTVHIEWPSTLLKELLQLGTYTPFPHNRWTDRLDCARSIATLREAAMNAV